MRYLTDGDEGLAMIWSKRRRSARMKNAATQSP